jgi:MFS family permease
MSPQAVCAPVGGLLGHYLDRTKVLAAGCFIWAAAAATFAFCNTTTSGAAVWAVNGLGLALLIPNAQSLIADYFSELSRGKAFGSLYLTGAIGGMLGALAAANLGGHRPLGVEGWRWAFWAVALASALVGVLNLIGSVDPRLRAEPRYRQEPDIFRECA